MKGLQLVSRALDCKLVYETYSSTGVPVAWRGYEAHTSQLVIHAWFRDVHPLSALDPLDLLLPSIYLSIESVYLLPPQVAFPKRGIVRKNINSAIVLTDHSLMPVTELLSHPIELTGAGIIPSRAPPSLLSSMIHSWPGNIIRSTSSLTLPQAE